MENTFEIVRILVARGSDGQSHAYALTLERLVVVDETLVLRIEASIQRTRSFILVTDTATVDITSENLCMLISGRLWTEPARGYREASKFAQAYPPSMQGWSCSNKIDPPSLSLLPG